MNSCNGICKKYGQLKKDSASVLFLFSLSPDFGFNWFCKSKATIGQSQSPKRGDFWKKMFLEYENKNRRQDCRRFRKSNIYTPCKMLN